MTVVLAQAPARPVQPRAPKGPSPYVLKKEYDEQQVLVTDKIKQALNSSYSVRNSIEGKFAQVNVLNDKMTKVEEILSSANFQIALTSDSLKTTRNSIEEFRATTDTNLNSLNSKQQELNLYLYILFGVSILLSILFFAFMTMKLNKLSKAMLQQSLMVKAELQKNDDLKEQINGMRSKIQGDIYALKAEMISKFNKELDLTASQLKMISAKLNEHESLLKKPE